VTGGPTESAGPDSQGAFHAQVPVRWSDMDIYQHINHARMVTLLEEARGPFLFAPDVPTAGLLDGVVVVELTVKYQGQLRHADGPLDARMWISRLRAVDFTVGYEIRANGAPVTDKPAVTASVHLAAFDVGAQRPRRLTAPEREYLRSWLRA
jgi:acyl-CoA thioester hydrolase